jgi:DNA modification methylase
MIDLRFGDCLELMKNIEPASVDAIITDPPYGTTACKWDSVIDLSLMWEQLNRIIKPNGAIVLFGSEPFSSALRISNIKNYKYDWIWDKKQHANFANCKYQPLKTFELISVFCKHNYYPLMTKGKGRWKGGRKEKDGVFGKIKGDKHWSDSYYPKAILEFSNADKRNKTHPTQKPVALMEYLIKTYTNENETVLDFTAGSFSTGVACLNTNRQFIGIEKDEGYFAIGEKRMLERQKELNYG